MTLFAQIPRVTLSWADYAVMAAYMLMLIGLGVYYRKFAQADLENYYLAGRRFKGWMTGTSYAVTCMNADVAPAYCGMTVITGMWICWWYISRFGLALMIGAMLFAVLWRRLAIFTSPEFYEMRFAGAPALLMRSWVSLRSAFIAVVAWTGAGLLGMSKVAEGLLGWPEWLTYTVVIPVILLYVILSGYVGVVMSDVIQTTILIGSSIVLMAMVWQDFGGPSGLQGELVRQFGEQAVAWHPPMSHELLGVIGVIAWTVGTAVGYGGDVAPMAGAMEGQRLLSCKNSREAAKMYIWTEVMLFVMLALLTLPALGAMAKWPGLYDGTINKELSYGMLLGEYLPTGLLGLALVAMFASIMSTVDSNMNFGAQVFLNDVYRRSIRPKASMRECMRLGKVVMAVIMALALFVATQARDLIDISVFMLGLSSAELTANWGQWWWWRFNGPARLAASFGGPILFLLNKYVVFVYVIDAGMNTAYLVVLTSIAATCALWIIVALLTRPDPVDRLVAFYRRAKPMGAWGPIAELAQQQERDEQHEAALTGQVESDGVEPDFDAAEAMRDDGADERQQFGVPSDDALSEPGSSDLKPIFAGLGAALLGAVMVGAGTIALSSLYVAKWSVAGWAAACAVVAGLIFRRAFVRVMQRAHQADEEA